MSSPAYNSAYDAIAHGDGAALAELLRHHPGLEAERGERIERPASTLLEHAVWFRRTDMAQLLVDAGAPLNETSGEPPMTPIARALELGAPEIANLLGDGTTASDAAGLNNLVALERAPAPDADEARRCFRLACLNGAREAALRFAPTNWCGAEALTDALISQRHLLTWDEGETAWDWARFQLELANPANLFEFDTPDGQGISLLERLSAVGLSSLAIAVPAPAARTAPPAPWRACNSAEEETFMFACQWGQTERVRAMLNVNPALIHTRTPWHMGALYLPGAYSSDGSMATANLLLDAGAPPYDGIGGPAWWGSAAMVAELLARGAAPELPDSFDSGLLHACAASQFNSYAEAAHWLPIIEALLDAGADPNFANRYGVTPWGFAADEIRPLLKARGSDGLERVAGLEAFLQADDAEQLQLARDTPILLRFYGFESGCSAALGAQLCGNHGHGEALIAIKGEPDLNEAAAFGDLASVSSHLVELRMNGPRATAPVEGAAPLHIAASLGNADAANLLVAGGFSPFASNGADVAGDFIGPAALRDTTPTHLAASAGNADLTQHFLNLWRTHWAL